jgi:hypothetical protein
MMVNLFSKLFQQIKPKVVAKVIQGGELKSKKVNLPNTKNTSSNDGKRYC